jgi:hypothetical protein
MPARVAYRKARAGGRKPTPVNIRKLLSLLIFFYSALATAADDLGRLFLTPAQRAQLETVRAQRDRRLPIVAEPDVTPAPMTAAQGPGAVTYSGVVRRSDGKATVWINGKPVNERSMGAKNSEVNVLGLRRDGAVSVAIPHAGRTGSLKVGQRMDVTSGRIEESYARRDIPIQAGEADLAGATTPRQNTSPPPSPSARRLAATASAAAEPESQTRETPMGVRQESRELPAMRVPRN